MSDRRRVSPGEIGTPIRFEIQTDEGWIVRFEGTEAAEHVAALDNACAVANAHGVSWPAAEPFVMRATPAIVALDQLERINRDKMSCGHFTVYAHSPDRKVAFCTLCRIAEVTAEYDSLRADRDHMRHSAGTDSCADYAVRNRHLSDHLRARVRDLIETVKVKLALERQVSELLSALQEAYETCEELRRENARLDETHAALIWLGDRVRDGIGPVTFCTTEDGDIGLWLGVIDENAKTDGRGDEALLAVLDARRRRAAAGSAEKVYT